jgi:hypothetical protein
MKKEKEIEIPADPMQTVRDPADGKLKTTIPNPFEIKKDKEKQKEEVSNA